ncbi:hypothetical protein H632_c100p0, partial [Helicosporidium sp. ATCC 50920]
GEEEEEEEVMAAEGVSDLEGDEGLEEELLENEEAEESERPVRKGKGRGQRLA